MDGDRRQSWESLADRVARLGGALRELGMTAGGRVAMLADNSHRYIAFYYAAVWGGGVFVPLNTRLAGAELRQQLEQCGPEVLIADDRHLEGAARLAAEIASVRALVHAGDGEAPAGAVSFETAIATTGPIPDAMREGDDLACIFFTGGTTGRAKGVMLSHANLVTNALHSLIVMPFGASTVQFYGGPLFHLAAGARIFAVTLAGGRHLVAPRFTPSLALETIEKERATIASFVPTMLQMLVDEADFGRYDLSSLSLITYGGSPISEPLMRQCRRMLPHVGFGQAYGMTELSPMATYLSPADHDRDDGRLLRSAGRALPACEVVTVDPAGAVLAANRIGEIVVRGPIVMQGYWQQPQETEQALRGGWMHTGDAGYLDEEGYLFVVDRVKDMIISGGENVYSTEVEYVVCQHPAVAQCAVIGMPDRKWGERVHAEIVLRPGAALVLDELDRHCRERLAGYKCPRSMHIREQALPLSAVNKVDKVALRREVAALPEGAVETGAVRPEPDGGAMSARFRGARSGRIVDGRTVPAIGLAAPIGVEDPACDGADFPVANGISIDPGYRHDPASGRGDEDFVGIGRLVARDQALDGFQADLGAKLQYRPAGHSIEHPAGGGGQPAVLHDEDVEAGPFGQVLLGIDEHLGIGAAVEGFHQPQRQIQPMKVLDPRVQGGRRDSLPLADQEIQALGELFLAGDRHIGHREGIEAVVTQPGIAAAAGGGKPARHHHLHIGVPEPTPPDAFQQDLPHLVATIGGDQTQGRGIPVEAGQMILDPERDALPDMEHVVGRVGTNEAAIHHWDPGLSQRDIFPVHKGDTGRQALFCSHFPIPLSIRRASRQVLAYSSNKCKKHFRKRFDSRREGREVRCGPLGIAGIVNRGGQEVAIFGPSFRPGLAYGHGGVDVRKVRKAVLKIIL